MTRYPRALFYLWKTPRGEAMLVVDRDHGMSVTNDAEAVVAYVLERQPGKRIIYRDTTGRWDELRHDGKKFTGFAPLSAQDLKQFAAVFT